MLETMKGFIKTFRKGLKKGRVSKEEYDKFTLISICYLFATLMMLFVELNFFLPKLDQLATITEKVVATIVTLLSAAVVFFAIAIIKAQNNLFAIREEASKEEQQKQAELSKKIFECIKKSLEKGDESYREKLVLINKNICEKIGRQALYGEVTISLRIEDDYVVIISKPSVCWRILREDLHMYFQLIGEETR